ncbi:MAG: TRAP transporter small permease [Oscillospiraceae bacterium]|nr:TRAP transporter small permease [Oscillospiraceae bacterium]
MLNILKKIDDIFEYCANWIMTITGIATCTLIVVAGFMRYFLKMDFYGYEELTLFAAFWLYFMGSAIAGKKDTHINANMMSMFCKNQKVLNIVELIKVVICLVMCAIATKWCFDYVMWSGQMGAKSNVFKLPNIIAQIPMFISFFAWTLYLIRDLVKTVKLFKNKPEIKEEVEA